MTHAHVGGYEAVKNVERFGITHVHSTPLGASMLFSR
jgi:hypothetical protein